MHAAVGDSCSLAMALPRGIGFRGFRGSVCRPRPRKTPHMAIRSVNACKFGTFSIPILTTNINILHCNVSKILLPIHAKHRQRLQLLEAKHKHEVCGEPCLKDADGKP